MKHLHGGNIYQYGKILDFSANLNPLGMPEAVRKAAKNAVDRSEVYPDPDCKKLTALLSEKEGVPESQLICGNGAAELLFLLAAAVKPKQALLTAPSFAEYEQALRSTGCQISFYERNAKDGFQIESDYLDALSEKIDMAFLCNPNNPTGTILERGFLERVLEVCRKKGILLVVDECFLDFLEDKEAYSMVSSVSGGSLFIVKAFTKIYAMAGLRLGYGITAEEALIGAMEEKRQPWSVSVPAQAAGAAALSEDAFVKESVQYVKKERKWLEEKLKAYPFTVYPGSANYLFFQSDRKDLKEALIPLGILIRDCENYRGLSPGYYRIAVRTHLENEMLIQALNILYQR